MAVVPSALLGVDSAILPSSLWDMAFIVLPNWRDRIVTQTAFLSEITTSKSDAEQRRGFFGKPTHSCEATISATNAFDVNAIHSTILRSSMARRLAPLYSDETVTISAGGVSTILCETRWRRFSVGARVVVVSPNLQSFAVFVIQGRTDTSLTLNTTIPDDFGAGCRVFPLIEARLMLSNSMRILTDSVAEMSLIADELPGKWSLASVQGFGSVPSGFTTYLTYPILDLPCNYRDGIDVGVERSGDYSSSGLSQIATVDGTRGRVGRSLPYLFSSRADFWRLLQFFESRGGRTLPFWTASPTTDFSVVSLSGVTLEVVASGPVSDWSFRGFIALVKSTGQTEVRRVESVLRTGNIDTVTLDSDFSTNVFERLAVARLSRFTSDELAETWSTLEVCECDLSVLELTREESVTIANLAETATSRLPGEFNPFLSGGASEINAPMHYHPCQAPTVVGERPAGRAADLLLPLTFEVTISPEFIVDSAFPLVSGNVSLALLAALPGKYECGNLTTTTGKSGHWHHVTVSFGPTQFTHASESPSPSVQVTRHRWRATKAYGSPSKTITVDLVAEWSTDGAAGVLFNIYVYSNEINPEYEEDAAFSLRSGRAFSKLNPAVWGGLAFATATAADKFCHPQMLICASVPTSWTAPCGNQSFECTDSLVKQGFRDCITVANGAPWVRNNAEICKGNVVYGLFGELGRAMTLGGDCPQSELFDHIIVENKQGLGITALRPTRSGWNESTGTLDIVGGSPIYVRACLPPQTLQRIDCCEGKPNAAPNNPNCWRPGNESPNICDPTDPARQSFRCCFSTDSVVTLRVTQKCICTNMDYNNNCAHIGPFCPDNPRELCGWQTKEYILPVCKAHFGPSQRDMIWSTALPDPLYIYMHASDNFDDVNSLNWFDAEGTWLRNDLAASGIMRTTTTTAGPDPDILTPWATVFDGRRYRNLTADIECLTAGKHGIAIRSNATTTVKGRGYAAIANTTTGTLQLVFIDRNPDVTTVLAQTGGLTFSAPFNLKITAYGNRISAMIDDDPTKVVFVSDCRLKEGGFVAIISFTPNSDFDNFEIRDGDFDLVYATVTYTDAGWGIFMIKGVMPFDQDNPNGCKVGNPSCGVSVCNCRRIARTAVPDVIVDQQSISTKMVLPGRSKPWSGQGGGPPCVSSCVGCSSGDPPCAVIGDFLAATVRVSGVCSSGSCPEGSESQCAGVDYWYGSCGTG